MANTFSTNNILTNQISVNKSNPIEALDISGALVVGNTTSINVIYSTGNFVGYQQININNFNPGQNSSSDIVATSDIGSESNYYVNLGINSSTYTGQSIGFSGDSYLYSQANDFYIGNTNAQKRICFFVSGNVTGINGALMVMDSGRVGVSGNLWTPGGLTLNTTDSGNLQNQLNSKALYVPLSVGSVTWSTMQGAVTLFNNNSASITYVDLSLYTGVNLTVNKGLTAGSATGALFLGYRGNPSFAALDYSPIDTTSVKLFVNVTGQLLTSGFRPLVPGAKSGVYIALLGSGGAALSPIFGNISAFFK